MNELNKKRNYVILECALPFQSKEEYIKNLLVGNEKEMSKWIQTKKWWNLNIAGKIETY